MLSQAITVLLNILAIAAKVSGSPECILNKVHGLMLSSVGYEPYSESWPGSQNGSSTRPPRPAATGVELFGTHDSFQQIARDAMYPVHNRDGGWRVSLHQWLGGTTGSRHES